MQNEIKPLYGLVIQVDFYKRRLQGQRMGVETWNGEYLDNETMPLLANSASDWPWRGIKSSGQTQTKMSGTKVDTGYT